MSNRVVLSLAVAGSVALLAAAFAYPSHTVPAQTVIQQSTTMSTQSAAICTAFQSNSVAPTGVPLQILSAECPGVNL